MTGMGGPPGPGNSSIVAEFHHALALQCVLILALLAVLFVLWNQLRSMQYRRAVARGERFDRPPRAVDPEPPGRRFLRIAFGLVWLFDGLLQLQSGMPLGLPTGVIQPAAATSPGWVQHLVNSGLTLWERHPAAAAASTVWIQVGIGLLLLVAPRWAWSRVAGLVSVGWGLIVWSFGNAFGGIFAPGATFLFGAPGAVLFYVVAGALVALPPAAWAGHRLGRAVLAASGVLLVGFAVLQAWPGRGFWQGTVGRTPGTLTGMVDQMAQTSQPRPLASLLSSFSSFDGRHGWGVNLFAVVAMAVLGVLLLLGARAAPERAHRPLFPAMVALAVLCIGDWVLIEDFGFWGGVGTDPNSMLPFLFVVTGGYLAATRPGAASVVGPSEDGEVTAHGRTPGGWRPVPIAGGGPVTGAVPGEGDIGEPVGFGAGFGARSGSGLGAGVEAGAGVAAADSSPVTRADAGPPATPAHPGAPARRSWWEGIDSRLAAQAAASVAAVGILLIGVAPMAVAAIDRTADPQLAVATDGVPNVTSGPAPSFRLVDQTGATVSLADLRGYTVVLTFLDPVCTTDCPIIAQEIRTASNLLGGSASRVRLVAVVANPVYRSVQTVDDFDRQEGFDTQANWLYLTGSEAALEATWYAYGVTVETSPAGGMVAHADLVYIIDSHGSIRRILNSDPGTSTATSESSFSGLLASQVSQVQHQ